MDGVVIKMCFVLPKSFSILIKDFTRTSYASISTTYESLQFTIWWKVILNPLAVSDRGSG